MRARWIQELFGFAALAVFGADVAHAQLDTNSDQSAGGFFALPVALRYEGVGALFGGAVGYRNLPSIGGTAVVGGSAGAVRGFGVGLVKVPVRTDTISLSGGLLNIDQAQLLTKYRRGVVDGPLYLQSLGVDAVALKADFVVTESIGINVGFINSAVQLKSYRTEDGADIALPGANLGDVKTLSMFAGIQYERKEDYLVLAPGYRFGVNGMTASGRSGQSDSLTTNSFLTGTLPLIRAFGIAARVATSDASILRRQPRYETEQGVAEAFHADCASLDAEVERARCVELSNDIQQYVAANNKHGTAAALGGNSSVRGYSESRFRAAHSAIISVEARWSISQTITLPFFSQPKNGLELAPFYDVGWSADYQSELPQSQRSSYGAGIRIAVNNLPIRLDAAKGKEATAWMLTVGYPW